MSDTAIAALNNRIETLTRELSEARTEAKTRRLGAKKLSTELEALKATVTTLTKERDDFRAKAEGNPTELQSKLDAAQGKLRERDHRDGLKALYDDTELDLSKSVPLDTVLKLIDYKVEGDAPDLTKVKAAVKAAQAGNAFLRGQHGTESQDTSREVPGGKPRLDTGLGDVASRGGHDSAARITRVRKSDMQDPAYMQRNQKVIAEASAAGTLTVIDG